MMNTSALRELSDSDDDDDLLNAGTVIAIIEHRERREGWRNPLYVEHIVPRYLEFKFRRLFRLSRETAEMLVERFEESGFYPVTAHGHPRITEEKTCLVVLTGDAIRWPTPEEQAESSCAFRMLYKGKTSNKRGLPNVIGCIDGCHIEIRKPS
ncbi:hypothetical protein HPB47_014977, partial [Ixodes persulcatus]